MRISLCLEKNNTPSRIPAVMEDPYADELSAACAAVRAAASVYMNAADPRSSEKKNAVGSYDTVTDADTAAQEAAVSAILSAFPDDRIIAEEGRDGELTGERTWIIDPIDGTLNYQHGIPFYGTQAVLAVDKEPVMSAILLPALGELFTATAASGARLNGEPVRAHPERELRQCIVSTGDFSRKSQEWRDGHYRIIGAMKDRVARIRMFGAACSDFAYLSAGRTDIHIRYVNKLWDFLPGLFMARVSGAYVDEELLAEKRFLLLSGTEKAGRAFREQVLEGTDFRAGWKYLTCIRDNRSDSNDPENQG